MAPRVGTGKTEDSRTIGIRVDSKTYDELVKRAKSDERTLSFYCAKILRAHIAKK